MKSRLAVALFLITPVAFAGNREIIGTIVDSSGVPVQHMRVEASAASGVGPGWVGGVPTATSDEHGQFVIVVPLSAGKVWQVYPHDESLYYPRLSGLFYQTEGNHGEIVTFHRGNTASVQLRLGPKAGALKSKVTDATTGAPLQFVTYRFAWALDPHNILDATIGGYYVSILLPSNTDLTLTVEKPGYKPWIYPGVINVGPGEDLPLDVRLQRVSPP